MIWNNNVNMKGTMKAKIGIVWGVILGSAVAGVAFGQTGTNTLQAVAPSGPVAATPTLDWLTLLTPLLVPLVLGAWKKWATDIPGWATPLLAPLLGGGLTVIEHYTGAPGVNPLVGVVLGLAGVGVRELQDQVRKTVTPANATPILFLMGTLSFLAGGCAALAPGADPIVVRAEQAQTGANATFETFLKIDDADRAFYASNAAPLHAFAEYLRQPVAVNGTNVPRDIGFLLSLDAVKQSYKAGKASSNDVVVAISVLETALTQTSQWISTTTTNH